MKHCTEKKGSSREPHACRLKIVDASHCPVNASFWVKPNKKSSKEMCTQSYDRPGLSFVSDPGTIVRFVPRETMMATAP